MTLGGKRPSGYRYWLVALALAIIGATFNPQTVVASYSRFLDSTYYTNGPTKKIVTGASFNSCKRYTDVQLTVYYNFLNATGMNVTKVEVAYYLKPDGAIAGGPILVTDQKSNQKYIGGIYGDYFESYVFKAKTKNREGYSLVAKYTHNGPVKVLGRSIYFTKYWTIQSKYRLSCIETNSVMGFRW